MDYCLEMMSVFPKMALKYDYQLVLIELFEKEKKYIEAANACKNLIYICKENNNTTQTITSLMKYGNIYFNYLQNYKNAIIFWKNILKNYSNDFTKD